MPNYSPVYRLPFLKPGEVVTEAMERTRYMTIDRQLEALFTFLGDGVMTGWNIIQHPDKNDSIILQPGSGVADSIAVATNIEYEFALTHAGSDTVYYVYIHTSTKTPYTAAGEVLASQTVFDTPSYLILGTATVNDQGKVINIDMSESSGRSELTFLSYLISSISAHVHTGAPGEPGKIDLYNHVKGVLSAAHLEDLPASKITSGIFDKERFRLSHNDLEDVGTLTHTQIDSLIEKFQNVNKLLFGDLMTANLIQLILSLKHVWADVDEYFYNFIALIPGIDNNKFLNSESFIDSNATSAEIDYLNHRIRGKYVASKEIGQYVINSVEEFSYDGDGDASYDPIYIQISGRDDDYGYGYGYGFGEGMDYFDVLWGPYDDSGNLTVGVSGTTVGYGLPEFESTFSGGYGFGYGYEQFTGFSTTLTSTRITLVSDSSSSTLHDKDLEGLDTIYSDETYISYNTMNNIFANVADAESTPSQIQFLTIASDAADLNNSRGDRNFHPFTSDIRTVTGDSRMDADQSLSFITWSTNDALDVSVDNYMYFMFAQVNYRRGTNDALAEDPVFIDADRSYTDTFDPNWSPDVKLDLIIESTIEVAGDDYRVFYQYAVDGVTSVNSFLDKDDNDFFENYRYTPEDFNYNENVAALARIQAQIISDNLVPLGAFQLRSSSSSMMDLDDATLQIAAATAAAVSGSNSTIRQLCLQNITGIYLYTKNDSDYGFDFTSDTSRSLYFPMGRRNATGGTETAPFWGAGLKSAFDPDGYSESTMLVDLARIYVGGTPGFRYDPSNNVVRDLTITFPDPVTLNSISWISSEPSDTIVYIQTKRLDSLDGVDSVYNENSIFTNNGIRLNNSQLIDPITGDVDNPIQTAWLSAPINPSAIDYAEQMAQKYRPSGSDFPSEYQSVRSVSLKAVLLPSTDLTVAPTLNSIIINYTSNTRSGDLLISTEDQWSNFRAQSAITRGTEGSVDYVTIDMPTSTSPVIGKVNNLIYGTDSAIVEVGNSGGTWLDSVKVFYGNGPTTASILPLTVKQEISEEANGISGYVTNLQKRKNGNIVFLDQDSSRIVELDLNYEIQKIITSEYAYKNTMATWMPSNLTEDDLVGGILKAIYNPDVGDNGVIYLVFSHELKAWDAIYSQSIDENVSDYDPTVAGYVDLNLIQMVVQATDVNFSDCSVYAVDRGVLCIELTETKNNYILGNLANEIKLIFNTESRDISLAPSPDDVPVSTFVAANDSASGGAGNTCVVFKGDVIVQHGLNRVPIDKPDYDIIFAPIQGIVAFDVDDDDMYYILKRSRPYTYGADTWVQYDENTHASEPWYVKMSGTALWDGWVESTKNNSSQYKEVIPIANFRTDPLWEPDFSTGSIYGYRGTIQKKDNYLLMCLSGEKNPSTGAPDGVFIFSKETGSSRGNLYGGPDDFQYVFDLSDDYYDDTYLMAARFDPLTYNESTNIYGSIYVAISDLKRSSSINSKSKVVKIDPLLRAITWEWGTKDDKEDGLSNSFALVVNDVMTLSYDDTEVIIST